MLVRIVLESLARRRRRKLLSGLAVALGIAVTAAVGTIALDVGDKVSRELRSFGANISVTPAADSLAVAIGGVDYRPAGAGAFLPESQLVKLKRIFWRNNIVAFTAYLYVPVVVEGRPAVLIGSWFEKALPVDTSEVFVTGLKKLHPIWNVQGQWPTDPAERGGEAGCLVGRRLADWLRLKPGQPLTVSLATALSPRGSMGRQDAAGAEVPASSGLGDAHEGVVTTAAFMVRGIVETGGPEDDQVLVPLAEAQRLAGLEEGSARGSQRAGQTGGRLRAL